MVACADTSFLFALYGNDVHTPKALAWVQSASVPVSVSEFSDYELSNALRFAEFTKRLKAFQSSVYLEQYEIDRDAGRIRLEVCNLAVVVREAKRLSAAYTLLRGHRAFDVLHVAVAVTLKADCFLTYDSNQKLLAEAEGIKVPTC